MNEHDDPTEGADTEQVEHSMQALAGVVLVAVAVFVICVAVIAWRFL